jgi:ribosomal-protein-alanine N-acetyltransferase
MTLLDLRALHRLERVIFPLDAYPYTDLLLLFLWPTIVNLKVTAPDGSLAGIVSGIRALAPDRAWIITIGTAPAHQRRGLGAFMLHTMEQRIGRRHMRLTVRASNDPAIQLYERTGYEMLRRKRGYYRDGEDGLVMEKDVHAWQDATR